MDDYIEKIKRLLDKEMVRYVIAGGMTTGVNIVSFFFLRLVTDLSRSGANVIAIMLAIIFAYFANSLFVFKNENKKTMAVMAREFVSFVGVRLFAMLVEVVGTNLLCDSFMYNELVSKIVVQAVVLVINYLFSKCFVFKKEKRSIRSLVSDNFVAVISFAIPAVFMLVLWIVAEIGPFGGNSLTMVDSLHQYLPFFSDYHDKLVNEGSLFYTWDIGLGSNLLDIIAYYMSCPLNFIIVLFDREHIYIAMCILISLKIALSGMSMASYLGYRGGNKNNLLIVPFAVAYALNNYVIGYSWNLMWMDCIMILPVIMMGFERMMKDGSDYKLYVLGLFYGLLCNYYICFMICIFLVLQFLLTNHKSIYKTAEDVLRFTGTSVLAAMMAAFLLIPAYLGLNTTASATRVFPKWEWYGSIWDIVKQMFILTNPIKSQSFDGGVNLYCGTFAILLLGIYLFNTRIKWYDKLKTVVILVILMMSFNNKLLNYVWHGLHDQYGIPNRFSFLFIFVVLAAGYEALVKTDKSQLVGVSAGIIAAFGFFAYAGRNMELADYSATVTWVLLMLYAAAMVAIVFAKVKSRQIIAVVLAFLCMTEMIFSAAKGYESNGTVDINRYYSDAPQMEAAIASVKTKGFPYRMELNNTKVVDESIYHNMQGVSLFGSTVSNDLVNAMHALGFYTGANEFLFDGANPVSCAVLGIRYVFRRPEDYMSYDMSYADTVEGIDIYQNERSLNLGFMVDRRLLDWSSKTSNMFDSINSFVEKSTGIVGTFSQIYPEVETSSHDITINHSDRLSEYYALSDVSSGINSFSLWFNTTDEQNDLYIIANCNGISDVRIYVDDVEQNYDRLQYQTYHVGHLSKGTKVEIEYCFNKGVPENTSARLTVANLNKAAFDAAYDIWSRRQLKVSTFQDGYVKGNISVDEPGLLFTSIPYDSGWKAYVDKKEVEIKNVAGAFIALDMKPGNHKVEFKYFPRGLKSGIVLTVLGWFIFALLLSNSFVKKKNKKTKSKKKKQKAEDAGGYVEKAEAGGRDHENVSFGGEAGCEYSEENSGEAVKEALAEGRKGTARDMLNGMSADTCQDEADKKLAEALRIAGELKR